jgi:hypothetical protein
MTKSRRRASPIVRKIGSLTKVDPGKPFVLFCTPTLDGTVHVNYLAAALATNELLEREGITVAFNLISGDPYLAKVRNHCATDFLHKYGSVPTHMFFLDADVGWPAEAALRMVRADKDVIAGVYPKRSDNVSYPVDLMCDEKGVLIRDGDLVRAVIVPTGFLCVKRHVVEKFAGASGRYADIDGQHCYNIFQNGFHLESPETMWGRWWGEDTAWCKYWQDVLGGEIWVYPDIDFTHRGPKIWTGNLKAQIDARDERLRAAKPKPNRRRRLAVGTAPPAPQPGATA